MKLTWYGTANLVFTAEQPREEGQSPHAAKGADRLQTCGRSQAPAEAMLAFDPFVGFPIGAKNREERLRSAKPFFSSVPYVLITHGHLDHIYHIPDFYRDTPTMIYGTDTPCRTLQKKGVPRERLCRIAPGFCGDVGPFFVRAWQSRHCKFDTRLILRTIFRIRFWKHPMGLLRLLSETVRYPENGEILFYEVSASGMRIQVMGSLNLDQHTDYPTGADYLILPFQGRSDLESYAMALLERLRPKAVLLDHWDDTFPPLSDRIDTEAFAGMVRQRLGISCRALKQGETITL